MASLATLYNFPSKLTHNCCCRRAWVHGDEHIERGLHSDECSLGHRGRQLPRTERNKELVGTSSHKQLAWLTKHSILLHDVPKGVIYTCVVADHTNPIRQCGTFSRLRLAISSPRTPELPCHCSSSCPPRCSGDFKRQRAAKSTFSTFKERCRHLRRSEYS
eukprot:1010428-Amphidinium_carterae.1